MEEEEIKAMYAARAEELSKFYRHKTNELIELREMIKDEGFTDRDAVLHVNFLDSSFYSASSCSFLYGDRRAIAYGLVRLLAEDINQLRFFARILSEVLATIEDIEEDEDEDE